MKLSRLITVLMGRGASIEPAWYNANGDAPQPIVAYQAIGAADYATSKVNLVAPGTYDAADGAAYPTWDDTNGWIFVTASSQYLDSGIDIPVTYSYIIRFSNAASGAYTMLGSAILNAAQRIMPNRENKVYYGAKTYAPGMSGGVLCIAGLKGYRDGEFEVDITNNQFGIANTSLDCWIGCQHEAAGGVAFWTGYIQAMAIYDVVLTAPQVAAITTAMNAL